MQMSEKFHRRKFPYREAIYLFIVPTYKPLKCVIIVARFEFHFIQWKLICALLCFYDPIGVPSCTDDNYIHKV